MFASPISRGHRERSRLESRTLEFRPKVSHFNDMTRLPAELQFFIAGGSNKLAANTWQRDEKRVRCGNASDRSRAFCTEWVKRSSRFSQVGQSFPAPHSVRKSMLDDVIVAHPWCRGVRRIGLVSSTLEDGVPRGVASTAAHETAASLEHWLAKDAALKLCVVSGKGGTGKTTTSAAIAYRMASSGLRTLILSTDPAHSLGDALDVDLGSGHLEWHLRDNGPLSVPSGSRRGRIQTVAENLDALEIDTAEAIDEFRRVISTQNAIDLSKLGLSDVQDLLDTVPPGADEFVALARVLDLADHYDRLVIDTAPSGHTLRLLAFPDFLDSFLGKVLP